MSTRPLTWTSETVSNAIAVVYQWRLAQRGLAEVSIVGLGFGGWIATEQATMSPRAFRRLVLVKTA